MGLSDLFDDVPKVSVSQYTAAIKRALEGAIAPCWVVGEVSNFRRQSSGHLYFSLKDAGAQLPAVMFRGQASRLAFQPRDGMEALAIGELSVYEPYGRYQLIVRELRESGQGRLFREFERLKGKLSEEGLFDASRKRPLPSLPLRVAMVTSPTGAALQDFLRILDRRGWRGRLQVYPVKVQGQGAAEEIEAAIDLANAVGGYDALVVGRGGGSIEDLWPFNEERVARAVARSRIPVISAVGHEIDFTLSDFAADTRAETPSAAAEMLSSLYLDCIDRLETVRTGLADALDWGLEERRREVDTFRRRLAGLSPASRIEGSYLRLDELAARVASRFQRGVYALRRRWNQWERRLAELDARGRTRERSDELRHLATRLETALSRCLEVKRGQRDLARARWGAMDPKATLRRGFAILRDDEGRPVTSVAGARTGGTVRATLKDGELDLTVKGTRPREGEESGGG